MKKADVDNLIWRIREEIIEVFDKTFDELDGKIREPHRSRVENDISVLKTQITDIKNILKTLSTNSKKPQANNEV